MVQAQVLLDSIFSSDEIANMVNAIERRDFIRNTLIPKLMASESESQKFNLDKLKYLIENNFPMANTINNSQFEDNLVNFPNYDFSESPANESFCSITLRLTLYGIVVVGALVTEVIVVAIAVAIAPYIGGFAAALLLLAQVGIAVGVTISVFLIEKLVTSVCGA